MKSISQRCPFGLYEKSCLDFRLSSFWRMGGSKGGECEDNCIPPSPIVSLFHFMIALKILTSLGDPDVFPCLRCNDTCVGLYKHSEGWLDCVFFVFVLFLFLFLFSVLLTAWNHFLSGEKNLCLFFTGGL